MRRPFSISFLFSLLLTFSHSAIRAEPVDDYIRAEMQKQNISGLSLAVLRDGKIIKAEGYGWANVAQKIPVTQHTVFQLQSITKSFTATGVLMLVEEGKVGLQDKISRYFSNMPPAWSNVTVRHLLTHTSGIKDFINEPTVDLKKDLAAAEDVIQSLADRPLNFAPGEKYAYSNTGYHLLGMIIYQVTGQRWGEFLRERIFAPLGMTETEIHSASVSLTNLASGYGWGRDGLKPGEFIAPTILGYAGGGMLSTVLDLGKWDAALYTGKLVKQSTLDQMWSVTRLNNGGKSGYGFGWGVDDHSGHRRVSHNGAHATGFKTTFMRFRDDKLTIAVLANQRGANPDSIALGVAGFFLPDLRPSALAEQPDPNPDRTQRLKSGLAVLANRQNSLLLTPEFQTDFAKSANRFASLSADLKGMQSLSFLTSLSVDGRGINRFGAPIAQICVYKMLTGQGPRYYRFYLTADNRLAQIGMTTE